MTCILVQLFFLSLLTIEGVGIVHLSGESSAVDDSLEHLVLNHPELHSVRIARSSCTDNVLQALMSNPNMLAIQLSNSNITGENLQLEPGVTLDLEVGVYKVLHFLPLYPTQSVFSQDIWELFKRRDKKGRK